MRFEVRSEEAEINRKYEYIFVFNFIIAAKSY